MPPHDTPARGMTPPEVAALLRVSPDRVRAWIKSGDMAAINTASARCRRPRYVVLPHQLAEFATRRAAAAPASTRRRQKNRTQVDYYPG